MLLLAHITTVLLASLCLCSTRFRKHEQGNSPRNNSLTVADFQKIPPVNVTAEKILFFFLNPFGRHKNREKRRTSAMFNVVYLVDSSRSIRLKDFKKGLRAIKLLTRKARRESNVFAAITFSTDAEVSFNFTNQRDAERKTEKLPYLRDKTNTQLALEKCKTELLENPNSGRIKGAESKVLIVTDGQSNVKSELTLKKAEALKQLNTEIFVAVGYHVYGMSELLGLASTVDSHLFRVQDMTSFVEIVKLIPPIRFQKEAKGP